jgi:hypothetical protein
MGEGHRHGGLHWDLFQENLHFWTIKFVWMDAGSFAAMIQ